MRVLVLYFLTTVIIKKLLKTARNKKKKHNEIVVIIKSKLNSIETLKSQAIIDSEISHKEFKTIINEKKVQKNKGNFRMIKSEKIDAEKDELNKEESKKNQN